MNNFTPMPDGLPEFSGRSRHVIDFLRQFLIPRPKIDPRDFQPPGEMEVDSITDAPEWLRPAKYDRHPDTMKPGALRLLSPWLTAEDTPSMVLLILGEWVPGFPLVVPFSTFTSPATQSELLTGLEREPLQVLQIWNARSAPVALVSEGWYLGHAPEQLVADAIELHRNAGLGMGEIPERLLPRLGTAILSATDPRRAHLMEGIEDFAPLLRAALIWQDWRSCFFSASAASGAAAILPFPGGSGEEAIHFPNLAAATDDKLLRCRRSSRTFGELLSQSGGTYNAGQEASPEQPFFVRETTPPAPSIGDGQITATFNASDHALQPGLPFLLIEEESGTVAGLGAVNLDGNLDLQHATTNLLRRSYADFHIVLPAR